MTEEEIKNVNAAATECVAVYVAVHKALEREGMRVGFREVAATLTHAIMTAPAPPMTDHA